MQPDIHALAQQVSQGILQAQSASPIGGAPEIAAANASGLYNLGQKAASAVPDYNTGVTVDNQKQAALASIQAQQAESDINKYQAVQNPQTGGLTYLDPNGKPVDVATVAAKTGQNPADLLKKSGNPQDIQYVQDYNNLQTYISAVLNGDTKTVNKFQTQEPSLKQYTGKGGLDQLVQDFQKHYQAYYVPGNTAQTGQPLLPSGPSGNGIDVASLLASLSGQ